MQLKANRLALKVAIIYVVFAGLWISFSDEAVMLLVSNPDTRFYISILKGWFFVFLTGGLLHQILKYWLKRWTQEAEHRKHAEVSRLEAGEKLRLTEAQLRLIMEASADGLWDWDLKLGNADLSLRYWEIIGYPAGDAVANREFLKRLVYPEDWASVENALDEHLAGKSVQTTLEYRILTKEGGMKWVWVRGKVIQRAPDGTPLRMVGTLSDITGRKLAEETVARERQMLRTLIDRLSETIYVKDLASRFLIANEAVAKISGKATTDEMLGLTDEDLFSAEMAAGFRAEELKVFAGEPLIDQETSTLYSDGLDHTVLTTKLPLRDNTGRICGLVGIGHDITKHKRVEAALRASQAKLEAALASMTDAVFISDVTGKFIEFNEAFATFHRFKNKSECVEQIADYAKVIEKFMANGELVPPDMWAVPRALRGETVANAKYTLRRKDTGETWVGSYSFSPIRDKEGAIVGSVVVGRDITERDRAQEALRESEAKFSKMFHSSPVAMSLTTTQEGRYLDVNDEFLQTLQRTRDEVIGRTAFDLGAWADPEHRAAIISKIKEHGSVHNIELEVRNKSGQLRNYLWSAEELIIAGESCLLGLAQDITERKQAETALQESQALYHSLVAQLPIGIFRKDQAGRFVLVNPGFCRLKKMKAEDFLGKTPLEVSLSEAAKQAVPELVVKYAAYGEDHHRLIMQTGKPIEMDEEYSLPNGQKLFVHVMKFPVLSPDGKVIGSQGIQFNITERKKFEQQMNLQLNALTAAANAIVITSHVGKIEWVNPAFTKLTGYSTDEAVGHTLRLLKSGQHPPGFYATLWATIITGNVWHGELVNRRKDGRTYSEDMTITPVRNADGQIAHFIAVKQDITERQQLENQLRQAQKMEAIGHLAGGVAHDFNNILVVIQLHAGMLKTEPNLSPTQLESASEIENAAQRAANLTRQMLLFSRQQALQLRDHDLNDIVTNITRMLQRVLRESIQIKFKYSPQALLIHADASMMDQVLMNLTVNARDAMPQGGQLVIETSAVEFDEVSATQTAQGRPGAFVCVSVADTGCGIPPEILPRIFEPFFTTKDVGKGTGLGLATIFGIVQQHQGWINVYSEVGHGTNFRVYLPRLVQTSDQTAGLSSLSAVSGGSEMILLVEDDVSVRASMLNALLRLGYRVLDANNGVEALEVWKEHRKEIRLLLTDMVMPGGMTGKDLAAQILREDPRLNVIYVSGYSAEIASNDFPLEEGVNYLTKPFEAKKLAQTVRNSLDRI